MKKGIVKFSKEFVNEVGLKEWYGVELEFDMKIETAADSFSEAKKIVAKAAGVTQLASDNIAHKVLQTELPVINKAEERLGILIENAGTMEELLEYKNECSTVYLADLWASKLSILNK